MASGEHGLTDDDVLSGFSETGPRQGELRGFFTVTIVASLYAWDIAFRFGAYHTVFFQEVQHVVVLAMALLAATLVVRRQIRVHRWLLALLTPPIILIVYRVATPVKHPLGTLGVIDDLLTILSLITVPILLWVTARLLAPQYFTLPSRRLKIAVIAIAAAAALVGYVSGVYNYRILTCEDFTITGSHEPANCRHGHPQPLDHRPAR